MEEKSNNRIFGFETTPKFNTGSFYCVDTNTTTLAAAEDCLHKYERKLIQRQDEIIRTLEKQICNKEQELIEKDRIMTQLENALEEACEELISRVSLY
jgi:hypothetical protein